jgi:pyruvate formate lyase activating enzyme
MGEGIIFDIKRYALHDGPGIRTTIFLKGCPLKCLWCHNPEGIDSQPEILFSKRRCAADCRLCIPACPQNALKKQKRRLSIDRAKCNLCGLCAEACVYEALQMAGHEVEVYDLITSIEKDRIFFEESGGGVTLSGGEPLFQMSFVKELLKGLKAKGLHVSLDTSGYAPTDDLMSVSGEVDLFLYDLKMVDSKKHLHYTRVSNELILANLRKLAAEGLPIEIRMPLISEVNDTHSDIRKMASFLLTLAGKPKISLLPYHKGGCAKYSRLLRSRANQVFASPSDKRIAAIKEFLSEQGFQVKSGG